MGGGRHPALWIDENFLKGASGPCPTFGTTSALPGPMESMEFVVTSFECWGFDGSNPLVEDASTPSQRSRAREEAWLAHPSAAFYGRRNHRCFSNNAPEKEPTTKQQIGKWLVGGGGSLAILTFGWDMWRHRQEQERVKNIIVNASFKAREPRVKIERKIMKEKQWNNGVLHIKLTQDNSFAKEEVRSALAVLRDEEVVRGLRAEGGSGSGV
eukprot:symbB.v1.2.029668.t1/scaffold3278.1/size59860/2